MKQSFDCIFINPRDLVGASPYVKLAEWAAVCRNKGFTVKIIEPAAEQISNEAIARLVETSMPLAVCISVFPSTLPDAYALINLIRKRTQTKIVIEGYYVNADANIVQHLNADAGFRGDADYSFTEYLELLKRGQVPGDNLDGVILNTEKGLVVTPPAFLRNINDLPIPAFDLLPIDRYYSASTNKRYIMLFTTRGCPYECNFCASSLQMQFRYLQVGEVMQRVRYLVNDLRVEWIEFMDLTFSVNKTRVIEICKSIIAEGLRFEWGCETRVDKVDDELLQWMSKAGCKKITFGVEAGSERVRALSGKAIPDNRFKEVFEMCRLNGIQTMANFIFGHPTETLEEMEQTIETAIKLKPFNVLFTRMIPLPDVEVFKVAVEEGKIRPDVWLQYMRGEAEMPVYTPGKVTMAQMDKVYKAAYRRFYFSLRTLYNYAPLLKDVSFLRRTINVFLPLAFGKVKFK